MNRQLIAFVTTLTLILSLVAYYVWQRLVVGFPSIGQGEWIAYGLVIFLLFQILGPFSSRFFKTQNAFQWLFHWINYYALGLFSCLFFYLIIADLSLVLLSLFHVQELYDLNSLSVIAAICLTLITGKVGALQARFPQCKTVEVPIAELPDEFEDFRIVQISDLHVGPTIKRKFVSQVVQKANALKPDLIVLTGDLVDGYVDQLKADIEPLGKLSATHGIFYISGNHEYYWNGQAWIKAFEHMGFHVLHNRCEVISKGSSAKLLIAGVPDKTAERFGFEKRSSLESILNTTDTNIQESSIKLLLAHHPGIYHEAATAGFDLQLSGHTHSGQFFPWSLLVGLVHTFSRGLNRYKNMWIYVNQGTGYWGPPIRFGVPGEITLLKLKRQSPK